MPHIELRLDGVAHGGIQMSIIPRIGDSLLVSDYAAKLYIVYDVEFVVELKEDGDQADFVVIHCSLIPERN